MKVNRIKADSNTKKKNLPIIWKKSLLRRICAFIRAGQSVLFSYSLGFWEEIKKLMRHKKIKPWRVWMIVNLQRYHNHPNPLRFDLLHGPFLIRRKSILANITEKKPSPKKRFCTGCQAWYHRAIWKMKIKGMFFFYKSPESIRCSTGEQLGFCNKKNRDLCAGYRMFFWGHSKLAF